MLNWIGASVEVGDALDEPGSRRRWRATAGGRPAEAIEADAGTEADAAQVAERLRRLSNHPDDALRPLLAWAQDGTRVWVATDAETGRTLEELLERGSLTPREAAAAGWAMLTALQVLHEAGLAHGGLKASEVIVGRSGRVAVGGHWFNPARRATADDLLADVQAAGELTCRALGIDGRTAAEGEPAPAEMAAPALTRTARAIAGGASGANVSGARTALAATAGSLVQPDGLARAAKLLAARVRGDAIPERLAVMPPPEEEVPPPAALAAAGGQPPPAGEPAPRPAEPPAADPVRPGGSVPLQRYVATAADFEELRPGLHLRRYSMPLMVVAGILIGLLLVWVVAGLVGRAGSPRRTASVASVTGRPATPTPSVRPSPPAATPPPAPTAPPAPNFGPPSADPIKAVELSASSCSPNSSCGVEVTVRTSSASSTVDVAWTIKALDTCTGAVTDVGTNRVTEQQGWTTVIGSSTVTVPGGRSMRLVAVTSSPSTAASALVPAGGGGC